MTADQVIAALKQAADPQAVEGMARFGSRPVHALGISIPTVRKIARALGKDYALVSELWASGLHEARILASMIVDSHPVTDQQMET